MASFHTKTFKIDDEYMTPRVAWEQISHLIPQNKILWEPFYGDGMSGKYLEDMGYNVIHKPENFFLVNHDCDLIISNPPYSIKREIFERLKELNKPFIMLCPSSTINTKYIYELFFNELQIIIPPKRIQFLKGSELLGKCNFDCFYYCYKCELPNDIIFLQRNK